MFRKYLIIGLAIIVTLSGSLELGAASTRAASKQYLNQERATASYNALQRYFFLGVGEHKLYIEEYPKQSYDNPYSYLWSLREATAATVDMAGLRRIGGRYSDDVRDRLDALQLYWDSQKTPPGYDSYLPPTLGQGGDIYYDDNAVVGLELERIYRMTGDKALLDRAEQVFKLIRYAWDDNPTQCPGGLYWTQGTWYKPIKATNVTALSSEFALHLYEFAHDPYYLEWGKRMYEWTRTCMQSPEGLYWNDIDMQGNINKALWIYNDGAMVGSGVLLYRITGDVEYLRQAESTAQASMRYFGSGGRYYIQPPIFDAIFFKNLLLLDSVHHDPKYRQAMQAYADKMWKLYRDPETGLFKLDANRPVQLLEQSAMVQIYAALAKDPRHDGELA